MKIFNYTLHIKNIYTKYCRRYKRMTSRSNQYNSTNSHNNRTQNFNFQYNNQYGYFWLWIDGSVWKWSDSANDWLYSHDPHNKSKNAEYHLTDWLKDAWNTGVIDLEDLQGNGII